jgi:cobyrinic acid a,c-diamide synthase
MNSSAFVIAATKSGSGKTLLTLGIIAALVRRGLQVQPFKCGPDFIDPTLHKMVAGSPSRNLDLFMMGADCCRQTFTRSSEGSDVQVVEGVMGLFDGGAASTAALARTLDLPVLLIVDARSAAESVAAVIKGFEVFDPALRLCAVILNQTGSERHVRLIRDAMAAACATGFLGAFPRDAAFAMPERHLGLHMGEEQPLSVGQIDSLAAAIEEHIDIDALLRLSRRKSPSVPAQEGPVRPVRRLRLAVARDAAFSFYYEDNLDILYRAGFDPVFFSPLDDASLPEGTDAVYIGGGYPELHAGRLSANTGMRSTLRRWVEDGGVLYCECGGLMYMSRDLAGTDGSVYPMVDVFPLRMVMKDRFSRLGYRTVSLVRDCLLGREGEVLHGHEFHYSEIGAEAATTECLYRLEDGRREGYLQNNALGSYVHLHFARSAGNVAHLYQYTLRQREKGERP